MNVIQKPDGLWWVVDNSGTELAGPFNSQALALKWIEDQTDPDPDTQNYPSERG
ncbi:hypothetical protein [Limnohabitans sp. T6-5]|uniref:hypothetical protein n=1 Tax=Limnohabitans sp. T6-5 TaxID=1100724 RepID=UPI001304B723|nr:hypothetical protein [Limnohabitans sp. T6-5]